MTRQALLRSAGAEDSPPRKDVTNLYIYRPSIGAFE